MSKNDLWIALGRAKADFAFRGKLEENLPEALKQSDYQLDAEEQQTLDRLIRGERAIFAPDLGTSSPFNRPAADPAAEAIKNDALKQQMEARTGLIVGIFKNIQQTFTDAHNTFRAINLMNYVMFSVGILMFIAAAIWGAISHDKMYIFLFGGLGSAAFIAQFLISPMEKTQVALSNLTQTQIAIMNFLEQLILLENISMVPGGTDAAGNPLISIEHVERSADAIQRRSVEAIQLLQEYVECDRPKSRLAWLRKKPRNVEEIKKSAGAGV